MRRHHSVIKSERNLLLYVILMDSLGHRSRPGVGADIPEGADVATSLRGLKSGLLLCLILAFLGFGGGLLIALVGFNSPSGETLVVSPPQREILYLPPTNVEPASRASTCAEPISTSRDVPTYDEGVSVQTLALAPDGLAENPEGSISLLDPILPPSPVTAGFEVAAVDVGEGLSGYHQLSLGEAALAPIAKGEFAALKAASVPEPTTVALVSISAVLLAVVRLRRKGN